MPSSIRTCCFCPALIALPAAHIAFASAAGAAVGGLPEGVVEGSLEEDAADGKNRNGSSSSPEDVGTIVDVDNYSSEESSGVEDFEFSEADTMMDVVLLETFSSKEMLKALNKRAEDQAAAGASWNVAGDGQMADQGGKMLQAQEDWLQDTIRTLVSRGDSAFEEGFLAEGGPETDGQLGQVDEDGHYVFNTGGASPFLMQTPLQNYKHGKPDTARRYLASQPEDLAEDEADATTADARARATATQAKGIKESEPATTTTVGNKQAKTSSGPRNPGFSFLSANPFRSAVKNLYSFVTKPFRPGFCREARSSKNYHTLENCYSPKRCSHPQIHDVCMHQGYVSPFADLFVLFRTGNGCRAVRNVNVVDTATRGAAVDKFAKSCVPLRHYCALQDLFETSRGRENRGLRRNSGELEGCEWVEDDEASSQPEAAREGDIDKYAGRINRMRIYESASPGLGFVLPDLPCSPSNAERTRKREPCHLKPPRPLSKNSWWWLTGRDIAYNSPRYDCDRCKELNTSCLENAQCCSAKCAVPKGKSKLTGKKKCVPGGAKKKPRPSTEVVLKASEDDAPSSATSPSAPPEAEGEVADEGAIAKPIPTPMPTTLKSGVGKPAAPSRAEPKKRAGKRITVHRLRNEKNQDSQQQ